MYTEISFRHLTYFISKSDILIKTENSLINYNQLIKTLNNIRITCLAFKLNT